MPDLSAAAARVLVYEGSGNLGDAIQTAAMTRLLPPTFGIFRNRVAEEERSELPFVVNGYLCRERAPTDRNTIFAGVFVVSEEGIDPQICEWFRRSRFPVGARDPYTAELLRKKGVDAFFLGCATMTLPRYEGPRRGVYSLNCDGPGEHLDQALDDDVPWPDQWNSCMERLETLRTAEAIYTSRLHVALPCLAMGTPVCIADPYRLGVIEPERFNMLDALGVPYDRLTTFDTSPIRERFVKFLGKVFGEISAHDYRAPLMA